MLYSPVPMSAHLPSYAVALAGRAITSGKVVMYVGAGASISAPTNLPTGANLSREIHSKLKADYPGLNSVDPSDLVAVADYVASRPSGEEALRITAVSAANFTTARPGYAHRVFANLMLEGAIDVLTTNWDNCIERGAGEERIEVVANSQDLLNVLTPSVLKIHGTASMPESVLVTSNHLSNPPQWVKEQTQARLGSAVVVFVGIGDVAGYVQQRVTEALAEIGDIHNIRIVSPSIASGWKQSQWEKLVPGLNEDHKIADTADAFAGNLAAAYVRARLEEHSTGLRSEPGLSNDLDCAKQGLFASEPLSILMWARSIDLNSEPGESVLKSPETSKVLVALGHIAGATARLRFDRMFETDGGPVELLISTRTVSTRRLVEEAKFRLQEHIHRGEPQPEFVIAGGFGPIPLSLGALPNNIVGDSDETDILDGPLVPLAKIRHADEVIST